MARFLSVQLEKLLRNFIVSLVKMSLVFGQIFIHIFKLL